MTDQDVDAALEAAAAVRSTGIEVLCGCSEYECKCPPNCNCSPSHCPCCAQTSSRRRQSGGGEATAGSQSSSSSSAGASTTSDRKKYGAKSAASVEMPPSISTSADSVMQGKIDKALEISAAVRSTGVEICGCNDYECKCAQGCGCKATRCPCCGSGTVSKMQEDEEEEEGGDGGGDPGMMVL